MKNLQELSPMTHAKYRTKARADIAANVKHISGEYGDVAKNMIDRRIKGLTRSTALEYMKRMKKEEVESIKESVPAKNQDVADKSYLKNIGKKPTIKSDLKNLKNFLTGKKETMEEITMEEIHPSALHVKPVKTASGTKYKVHAVGKKFASGIKVGEHLSDTELDDFAEMGGKIKHIKEQATLKEIMEMAKRGRPRKTEAAPAKKHNDEEDHDEYGPDTGPEANQNIHMQLKRAHDAKDLKGGADVHFEDGKKHFVKSEHAHKVLTALEKLKPADRAEASAHIYKSHENFKAVHSMLK